MECQRWANGVNVDSPHWAHVGLTYHYYLGVHWVEFMSLGLPGEFLFAGETIFFAIIPRELWFVIVAIPENCLNPSIFSA